MAEQPKNKIALVLRNYAEKIAAEKAAAGEGAPDSMTVADGQGGISTTKASIPKDVGESELKRDQPADGTARTAAAVPTSAPDRMTTADGQGGISTAKGTIPKDPGEEELKCDQPTNGGVRKAATLSDRAQRIRAALGQANPAVAAAIQKQAGSESAPAVPVQKQAGGPGEAPVPFNQETLAKIASAILATDEGVIFTHDLLEKQAGEEAARAQIQEALAAADSFSMDEQCKQAAFVDLHEKIASVYSGLEASGVTEEDADAIIKQAAAHQEDLYALDHPMLKAAYVQGMDDAALMAAAADGAGGAEGAPGMDEALPMGGEDLSEEEILALLEEMIASGEITEEDVKAALAATEGGAPPVAGGEEEAAAAAAAGGM